MDIVEVIQKRKSIRAFKPDPVPREVLSQIAELALRAPSWANTQPWELVIVSGAKLEAIKEAFSTQHGARALPDFPGPEEFPEAVQDPLPEPGGQDERGGQERQARQEGRGMVSPGPQALRRSGRHLHPHRSLLLSSRQAA